MAGPIAFGRYVLLDQLATGGMAEIFLARDTAQTPARACVIKRVLPHLAAYSDFVQMFLDEARIAARLHHPGIVQILDLGRQGTDYFFAMEYLAGEDMAAVDWRCRQTRLPIPLEVAMRIASLAADALHHAHELADDDGNPLNVVHRDVSPSNIFVTYGGDVKLLDFGIARAEQRLFETQAGQIKGKAGYLAPEQVRGRVVDRRADVWALGVCLHEMIRGDRLFSRETWLGTLDAVAAAPIPSLREGREDVPDSLVALMDDVLARNVEQRLPSAAAFHERLEEILSASRERPDLGAFLRHVFGTERAEARVHLTEMVEQAPAERVATENILLSAELSLDRTPHHLSATPIVAPTEPHRLTEVIDEGSATGPADGPSTGALAASGVGRTAPGSARRWWWMGAVAGIVSAAAVLAVVGWLRPERVRVAAPAPPAPLPLPSQPRPVVPPERPRAPLPLPESVEVRTEDRTPKREERARPKPKPPEERHPKKELVAAAELPGFLSLEANEPMNVTVDGAAVGTAPLRRFHLTPGEHRLKLENKLLGLARQLRVVVRPGEEVSRRESFLKGKLNVSSQPWADVYVDGRKLGTTPLAAREVWEGHHAVRLVGPQSEKTVTVDVVAGETAVIKEKLP